MKKVWRQDKCEICGEVVSLDRHHIKPVSQGGGDQEWNIVKICPTCHRRIHSNEIEIDRKYLTTGGFSIMYR